MKCISAEWMVKFHAGYPLDENDFRDVLALCRRFGIAMPSEYQKFMAGNARGPNDHAAGA